MPGTDGTLHYDSDRPQSIGKIKAYTGHFGMHVRALCYILANGPEGLKETTEVAVLNANYIRHKLQGVFALPYDSPTLHEVVFSDRNQEKRGVSVWDIGKRLIDYGFHPPTTSFPLIVSGAIMIEPTETESRDELDAFIAAMLAIAQEAEENPELVKTAPHNARIRRVDEAAAARKPVLRWKSTSLKIGLLLSLDPDFPILEVLLLPDRDNLLQTVDGVFAGVERGAAVRRRDDDRDAGLADFHMTQSVNDRDAADVPGGTHELPDFLHCLERHRLVGLILEISCRLSLRVVSHDAFEDAERAIFRSKDHAPRSREHRWLRV